MKKRQSGMSEHSFRLTIEEVRERTDILHVIGQRIALDRNHKGLCPFHGEKNPSFSVNPEGGYFYCFGCGTGGDVFKFLELFDKKSFMEALSELADEAGVSLKEPTAEERELLKESRQHESVLAETAQFYRLSMTSDVLSYLTEERGFTAETISCFQIGYAVGGLREHLTGECGFPLDVCLKSGVLKKTQTGEVRDFFYRRIVFPNISRGRVVHLVGRCTDGREPKYLNLPGEIRYLYNEEALLNKEVVIVEGVTDCISTVQAGFPAVALLGSSGFKPEYLDKFSRCGTIYVCFDGDPAGCTGAVKVAEIIGDRARIARLPEGQDLNDYLRSHSGEDLKGILDSSKTLVGYEIALVPADTNKTILPSRLEPTLRRIAGMDRASAEAYLNYEIRPRFNLSGEDLRGYRELIDKRRRDVRKERKISECDPEHKPSYIANFEGLVDLVENEGKPAFLVKDEEELRIVESHEVYGEICVPPPIEQIPWLLPSGEKVMDLYGHERTLSPEECDGALFNDLLSYHRGISELPDEPYYDLIAAWDIHTHLLEVVQYSPIICLFAVPERGKSRTGKGMIHVAYRGIHVESLRDAYLVRVASDLGASLFFDVKDIWRKAEKNGSEDILLHRFEKGARVPRVLYPERGAHRDIVYYSIFGPTIIGTNEGVHRILETRSVSINMPETARNFENEVTPALALSLKERLVCFRARHLGQALPEMNKPARGRLGDILKPLHQIIRMARPEREQSFLSLVEELQAERLVEKAETIEAQILATMSGLRDRVEWGILPVKTIADAFNEGRHENACLSYQRVGRRLSAMGFKKARSGNNSAILWDPEKMERMMNSYGLGKTHETRKRHETEDIES